MHPSSRRIEADRITFGQLEEELMTEEQLDLSFRRAIHHDIANMLVQMPRKYWDARIRS